TPTSSRARRRRRTSVPRDASPAIPRERSRTRATAARRGAGVAVRDDRRSPSNLAACAAALSPLIVDKIPTRVVKHPDVDSRLFQLIPDVCRGGQLWPRRRQITQRSSIERVQKRWSKAILADFYNGPSADAKPR